MIFSKAVWLMLGMGILETLYMVFVSSAISYAIGIPLGVILVVTDSGGIYPLPMFQKILGFVINLLRSLPFIILLLIALPLTRLIVGTTLGTKAVIVPLVIAATPYVARVVESSFKEVDAGVIEAAKSMGASTMQIIWKVLLPEAKPSLLVGAAISVTTILGYSAMSGFVGGSGLGYIAIGYGYYRNQTDIMMGAVVILVVIVQIIQVTGMWLARRSDRRIR